jgi:predicted metalloprotease with PDZ domain
VLADGAAARAGISAGDEILAVDGWRIRRLDEALQWSGKDQPLELLLVRDQRLRAATVVPDARSPLRQQWRLGLEGAPSAQALTRRRAWLGC